MGLLIRPCASFVTADRYLRSGLADPELSLSVGSLRDRKVGTSHGPHRQAIGRRLEASLVPVSYHSRNPFVGGVLQALSRPDGNGEGCGHADRDRARRAATAKMIIVPTC